jgi:hypothetical protein
VGRFNLFKGNVHLSSFTCSHFLQIQQVRTVPPSRMMNNATHEKLSRCMRSVISNKFLLDGGSIEGRGKTA